LHSLCWAGLRGDFKIITRDDLAEFKELYHWDLSTRYAHIVEDDWLLGISGNTNDDDLWMKIQLARLKDVPPEAEAESKEEEGLLRKMHTDYTEFKASRSLIDFTGMLEEGIKRRIAPEGVEEIFVDEAQDMCALFYAYHLMLYEALGESVPVTWLGDEDQSIYYFMGSDPKFFVEHPAEETVYGEQSKRMTDACSQEAHNYISSNKKRFPKAIYSEKPGGESDHMWNMEQVLEELEACAEGDVLWLALTNAQLQEVREELVGRGYPLKQSDSEKAFIRLVATITSRGRYLKTSDIRDLVTATVAGRKVVPYQRRWFTEPYAMAREVDSWDGENGSGGPAGGKISIADGRFTPLLQGILMTGEWERLLEAETMEKAEKMLGAKEKAFTIELSTFHKAKGREADYVVVCKDVSGRILKWAIGDEEGARRLGFVAMTRAKIRNIYYRKDVGKGQDFWKISR